MNNVIAILILSLSLLSIDAISKEEDNQKKLELISGMLSKSRPEKDFKKLVKKAKKGNVEAQFLVGKKYEEGDDIPKDINAAKQWYGYAAKNGHPKAKERLDNIGGSDQQNSANSTKASNVATPSVTQSQATTTTSNVVETAKDTSKTFAELELSAKGGDAASMCEIARRLKDGLGVQKDLNKSFSWYEKAAQKDNAKAMNGLAEAYLFARGTEKNLELSRSWLEKSAKKGYSQAQNLMARTYLYGIYGVKDNSQVVYWAKESVNNGDAGGLSLLGLLYATGTGVKLNEQMASDLFDKSALADSGEALYVDAKSLLSGGFSGNFSGGNAYSSEELGRGMLHRAVKLGKIEAQYLIAESEKQSSIERFNGYRKVLEMGKAQGVRPQAYYDALSEILDAYYNGYTDGVREDDDMAVKIFDEEMSKEKKTSQTIYVQGEAYRTGVFNGKRVLPVDNKKAYAWLIQAANQGHQDAMISVAVMYYKGLVPDNGEVPGYVKDIPKAITLAESAATTGNASHQANVGSKFLFGEDLPQDMQKAVKWLDKSANKGDRFGQGSLAWYYATVPHDYIQACKWFSLAGGDDQAGYGYRQKKILYCSSLEPAQKATAEKMVANFRSEK